MSDFTTEAFTLLGIGLFCIFLRTYARLTKTGMSGFKADDYLMLAAAVVYTAETVLAYTVGAYWQGLANNGMTDEERIALDPSSHEYYLRVNGSKTQVAGWSTYTLLLWLLKASMCTFYLRLTDGLDYRMRIYVGFGLIVTTWITVLLSILLGCRPFSNNWQIYPNPGNYCQPAISRIDIFVTVVLNVVTDLYLMSIPLPMLWTANLRPVKKLGLMVLFSGGIFVTMAGILRCVLILTNPVTGAQQAGSWACRETFVAVVTSNVPMIFPLVRRWGAPFFDSVRSGLSSKSRSNRSGGRHATGGTSRSGNGMFILEDKNPRRGQGPRSVNPIPNMTFSESEEYINSEEQLRIQQEEQQRQRDAQADQKQPTIGASFSDRQSHDLERQAPSGRPSYQDNNNDNNNTSQFPSSAGTRAGITKKVVLHITEEERRRRSDCGSEDSNSMDLMEAIQGAHRGNYFLTQQNQQPRRAGGGAAGSGGSGGSGGTTTTTVSAAQDASSAPSATVASPLAMHAWDGNNSDAAPEANDSSKRLSMKNTSRCR